MRRRGRRSLGIDDSIQVAPATLHAKVGFVYSPRLVCWFEIPSQSPLQLRAVILHPAPDRCVIDIETMLLQQFLNIVQRKRIAKIPPDRTKYETGFGLSPFEDRRLGFHLAILSRHQPATRKVATHPVTRTNHGLELRAGNSLKPRHALELEQCRFSFHAGFERG